MSNVVKISKLKKKAKSHVGVLSFLLVVAIICFLLTSPIFSIKSVTVSGNDKISSEEIISTSGITYEQNILRIDKFAIINKIQEIPYVKNAEIKRNWPNEVCIAVEENAPVAEIIFYGSKILLDENGTILEVVTDNTATDFVKFDGITAKSITTGNKLECNEKEKLESYLEILKIFKNNDMLDKIEKMFMDNENYLIGLNAGHVACIGDTKNLQYKILLLKEIIARESNPVYVDLSNLDMIVTKPVWGMFNDSSTQN